MLSDRQKEYLFLHGMGDPGIDVTPGIPTVQSDPFITTQTKYHTSHRDGSGKYRFIEERRPVLSGSPDNAEQGR